MFPEILGVTSASIILFLFGHAISNILKLHSLTSHNLFFKIGLGQLFVVFYMYLRSAIHNLGIPLSFYPFEIYFLLFPLLFLLREDRGKDLKSYIPELLGFGVLIFSVAVIIDHELPRTIMLSSDPDQHLFFAHQIIKLGGVPLTQQHWGPNSFGYPSGFAVISIIWSSLGFFSVGESIAIQPLLQCALAVFTVTLLFLDRARHNRGFTVVLALLTSFVLFWELMPHPLQQGHYHGEGIGRVSSLLMLATTAVLIISHHWWLSAVAVSVCAYLNPINVFIPGTLFGILLLPNCLRSPRLFLVPILFFITLFMEPYYSDMMTGHGTGPTIQRESAEPPSEFMPAWGKAITIFINSPHELLTPLSGLFLNKTVLNYFIPALILSLYLLTARKIRTTLLLWSIPLFLLLCESLYRPIFIAVRDRPKFYLLDPYLQEVLFQHFYLWFFACVGGVCFIIIASLRGLPYLAGLALTFFYPRIEGFRSALSTVNTAPRSNYCGAMGCVTDDDRAVLAQMEAQFKRYKSDQRPMSFDKIPKIVVANSFSAGGIEKWLIPWGASRVLPEYDTFPLAFYYFQGSSEYTFDNYRRKICKLDVEWIKERNIRFLFIPSEQAETCATKILEKINPEAIIFQSGKSVYLRLF